MSRYRNSWAILPATMSLYNKRTVDLKTANSTWGDGSILICEVDGSNGKTRLAFVHSAGGFDGYVSYVGKSYAAHHDQTMASKGMYKVVNVVGFENNEIVNKVNDIGLNAKASLAVFK